MSDDAETVWRVANLQYATDIFHTERDCQYLERAENVRPVSRDHIPDMRECAACSGAAPEPSPDPSIYHAALAAEVDDE